jgi:hypothetical protein
VTRLRQADATGAFRKCSADRAVAAWIGAACVQQSGYEVAFWGRFRPLPVHAQTASGAVLPVFENVASTCAPSRIRTCAHGSGEGCSVGS